MYIRILNEKDALEFRELRLTSLRIDSDAFGSTYEEEKVLSLDTFKNRLVTSNAKFTVGGFCDGKLVCIARLVRENGRKEAHKANLIAMYCEESYRGTGVAKGVVHFILKEAKKRVGLEVINLRVGAENVRAQNFYESLGFKIYGVEPKALFNGSRYFSENLMYLDLSVSDNNRSI